MALEEGIRGNAPINDPVPVVDSDAYDIVEVGTEEEYLKKLEAEAAAEGGKGEEKITLTPEMLRELRNDDSTIQELRKGFDSLGAALNKQGVTVPTQQPGESDADFDTRFKDEVFSDNPAHVVRELIRRELNPIAQEVGGITSSQAKDILAVKDDTKVYFSKYKKEIEAYHEGLPAAQRGNPRAWQYAYDEVLKTKIDDIATDKATALVDELLDKKLKELNINTQGNGQGASLPASPGSPHMETSSLSGQSIAPAQGAKKQAYITEAEKTEARKLGLTFTDYLFQKGRL